MFLYFLPHLTHATLTREALQGAGLGNIFRDEVAQPRKLQLLELRNVHGGGPGGTAGLIVSFPRDDAGGTHPAAFHASRQTWLPCNGGKYYVGRYVDQALTPALLERAPESGFTPGLEVELADGQLWEVPTVRRIGRFATLPRGMGLDPQSGQFAMHVLPAFDFAWEASGKIFEHIFRSRSIPWPEAFQLCCDVLSLNYRVGPAEVSLLNLLTTSNYEQVFEAAVDFRKALALLGTTSPMADENDDQKKTDPTPGSASTSRGPPAA